MKPATLIAIVIFSLIAVAHVLRLLLRTQITVGGMVIPMWVSGVAPVFFAGLAWMLWREARK